MAQATPQIIQVLRKTAQRISSGSDYQWGHMGSCNCGFLAQQVAALDREEIHSRAMRRSGDWTEQLNDYCPHSGQLMDDLIDSLLSFGFSRGDLQHLERLSDGAVLRKLPIEDRNLKYNNKDDSARYLQAWANLLEERWLNSIELELGQLTQPTKEAV